MKDSYHTTNGTSATGATGLLLPTVRRTAQTPEKLTDPALSDLRPRLGMALRPSERPSGRYIRLPSAISVNVFMAAC